MQVLYIVITCNNDSFAKPYSNFIQYKIYQQMDAVYCRKLKFSQL